MGRSSKHSRTDRIAKHAADPPRSLGTAKIDASQRAKTGGSQSRQGLIARAAVDTIGLACSSNTTHPERDADQQVVCLGSPSRKVVSEPNGRDEQMGPTGLVQPLTAFERDALVGVPRGPLDRGGSTVPASKAGVAEPPQGR